MILYNSILLILFLSSGYCDDNECVQNGPCRCTRKSDGASIDLSPITLPVKFNDKDNNPWQYSPCTAILCGGIYPAVSSLCKNYFNTFYEMGTLSSAKFTTDGSNINIQYTSNRNIQVTSTMTLVCDANIDAEVDYIREENPSGYLEYLTLKSKYACLSPINPTYPPNPTYPTKGLSVGDVLLIIFFIGLFLYFVIGILFMKFYRRVENKIDLIPNREFWIVLPFLCVDGVKFVMYKTVWRNRAPQPYTQI